MIHFINDFSRISTNRELFSTVFDKGNKLNDQLTTN